MSRIELEFDDCRESLREAQTNLRRLIREGRDLNGDLRTALAVVNRSLQDIADERRSRAA